MMTYAYNRCAAHCTVLEPKVSSIDAQYLLWSLINLRYTPMKVFALGHRFLPPNQTWRDLFDMVRPTSHTHITK